MNNYCIEKITATAWPDVARIYEAGIATGNATFQTHAPGWDEWDASHRSDCRLLAVVNGKIAGWAALSNVSGRCVYSGVAEVSIYIDPLFRNQGVGNFLMASLVEESERNGIWTLQAGIFPENEASLKLHQKHGFRTVGIRERIGKMGNTWRNVAMLERRSNIAGIN